jgi:spore maturation protein SpmA
MRIVESNMKRFALAGLGLLSVAASVHPVVANGPTQVGGVVLPVVDYVVLGMLALFILWIGFFLFRKRNGLMRFLAPMLRAMRT